MDEINQKISNEPVLFQNNAICSIKNVTNNNIICYLPPMNKLSIENKDYCQISVWIRVGTNSSIELLGHINYCGWNINLIHLIIAIILAISLLAIIFYLIFQWKKYQKHVPEEENQEDKEEINVLEMAKLSQINCSNVSINLNTVPRKNYTNFILKAFSLNENYLTEFNETELNANAKDEFFKLILEEEFLLHLIFFFEDYHFPLMDKICFANYLVIVLSGQHLSYLTKIMLKLLDKLIYSNAANDISKLLLIRTETIVERIVIAWLTILLYGQMMVENGFSVLLYKLHDVLREYGHDAPVDDLTKNAYNTLSYEKLLRKKIKFQPLNIIVSLFDQFDFECEDDKDDIETELNGEDHIYEKLIVNKQLTKYNVRVLDTDSVGQVIKKSLNVIYDRMPYSEQKHKFFELNLQRMISEKEGQILLDCDNSSKKEKHNLNLNWCQLNTMAHYQITDGQYFLLIPKCAEKKESSSTIHWHMEKQLNGEYSSIDRPITELMLNRLTLTKEKIQPYLNELFKVIFQTPEEQFIPDQLSSIIVIKFLFDYFDRQANRIPIANKLEELSQRTEIGHAWKSNSLFLRVWANIIANPHFILDIKRDGLVEYNLNIISQILMESCSFKPPKINANFPIEWFLFAEDFVNYNKQLHNYFAAIKNMDDISTSELDNFFHKYSEVCFGISF